MYIIDTMDTDQYCKKDQCIDYNTEYRISYRIGKYIIFQMREIVLPEFNNETNAARARHPVDRKLLGGKGCKRSWTWIKTRDERAVVSNGQSKREEGSRLQHGFREASSGNGNKREKSNDP